MSYKICHIPWDIFRILVKDLITLIIRMKLTALIAYSKGSPGSGILQSEPAESTTLPVLGSQTCAFALTSSPLESSSP
jgi:hypothetical protein